MSKRDRKLKRVTQLVTLALMLLLFVLCWYIIKPDPPLPPTPTRTLKPTATFTATATKVVPTATFTATLEPTVTNTVFPTKTPTKKPTFTPVPPIPTVEGSKYWWNCYTQMWLEYPRYGWNACPGTNGIPRIKDEE